MNLHKKLKKVSHDLKAPFLRHISQEWCLFASYKIYLYPILKINILLYVLTVV